MACRVDWLQVAYGVALSAACAQALVAAQLLADVAGRAEFREIGIPFELRRNATPSRIGFSNADVGGMFDSGAPDGWSLVLEVRAIYLATHAIEAAIALCRRIARGFGDVRKERLRRFDLSGDYTGFPIDPLDVNRLHTRARKRTTFLSQSKDLDDVKNAEVRMYTNSARQVTGITVAPGQDLMCRIYNKSAELALPGREQKRLVEEERWTRNGWADESVTRVEVQHRGEHLVDLGLRNSVDEAKFRVLDLLIERIDAIWQRDVREWLRIIDPESSTRPERCRIDPRWLPVQQTVFHQQSTPIVLHRLRGGPSDAQALGVVLSHAAAHGHLLPVLNSAHIPRREDGTDDGLANAMWELDVAEEVRCLLTTRAVAGVQAATDEYARNLVRLHGPLRAREMVQAKVNGVRARFFSVDDEREGSTCAG
ncbi:MAG TPA: hypothetical protein VJV79_17150 [Polyangiaceae bacterium]|nr:hypothetical protein [Polyangiaceae bacterium]